MSDSNITKNALAASLKQLMNQIPFNKISVTSICENCGLHRKSFYYHFKDKYDLMIWIFYTEFIPVLEKSDSDNTWDYMYNLIKYLYDNRKFYKNAFLISGESSFREYFDLVFEKYIKEYLKRTFSENKNSDFFAKYFTTALLSAIISWLITEPVMDPDIFFSLIQESMQGIAKRIVYDMQES